MSTEKRTIAYPFPLQINESTWFGAKGAIIDKAILTANDVVLSIIVPTYKSEETEDCGPNDEELLTLREVVETPKPTEDPVDPTEVDLDFFGKVPFHAALASNWNVKITLYVSDGNLPSLVFKTAKESVTWQSLHTNTYEEDVVAGSNSGPVNRTLIYTPTMGGFKRT